jgi:hypothetical protein
MTVSRTIKTLVLTVAAATYVHDESRVAAMAPKRDAYAFRCRDLPLAASGY